MRHWIQSKTSSKAVWALQKPWRFQIPMQHSSSQAHTIPESVRAHTIPIKAERGAIRSQPDWDRIFWKTCCSFIYLCSRTAVSVSTWSGILNGLNMHSKIVRTVICFSFSERTVICLCFRHEMLVPSWAFLFSPFACPRVLWTKWACKSCLILSVSGFQPTQEYWNGLHF